MPLWIFIEYILAFIHSFINCVHAGGPVAAMTGQRVVLTKEVCICIYMYLLAHKGGTCMYICIYLSDSIYVYMYRRKKKHCECTFIRTILACMHVQMHAQMYKTTRCTFKT